MFFYASKLLKIYDVTWVFRRVVMFRRKFCLSCILSQFRGKPKMLSRSLEINLRVMIWTQIKTWAKTWDFNIFINSQLKCNLSFILKMGYLVTSELRSENRNLSSDRGKTYERLKFSQNTLKTRERNTRKTWVEAYDFLKKQNKISWGNLSF